MNPVGAGFYFAEGICVAEGSDREKRLGNVPNLSPSERAPTRERNEHL